MEKEFIISDDQPKGDDLGPTGDSSSERILEILEMIRDPNSSMIEINRKIAMEIAHATSDIASAALSTDTSPYKLKALEAQVKALRELSRTLVEAENFAKRDILNFDGPKFKYVFVQMLNLFKQSMVHTGLLQETQVNNVLKAFQDKFAVYDQVLRKETDRITGPN
jgi:hypothetical protein